MKDVGLKPIADENTCETNVEQSYNARIANKSVETVKNIKCSEVKL